MEESNVTTEPPPIGPRLLDIDGAARYSGLTIRHLRALVAQHRVPFARIGRRIYFRPQDIDAWIADLAEASAVTR